MADWWQRLVSGKPDFEGDLVERYTQRLLHVARRELPERMRGRLDPEDIVQSVYRSFFRRLSDGQFAFDDSQDVWRLLAVMTYHKAKNVIQHHQRECRDVRRERLPAKGGTSGAGAEAIEDAPGPADAAIFFDCLEHLLAGLPDRCRTIVSLRLEGNSVAEVAEKIQCSRRTVFRVLNNVQETALNQLDQIV